MAATVRENMSPGARTKRSRIVSSPMAAGVLAFEHKADSLAGHGRSSSQDNVTGQLSVGSKYDVIPTSFSFE